MNKEEKSIFIFRVFTQETAILYTMYIYIYIYIFHACHEYT